MAGKELLKRKAIVTSSNTSVYTIRQVVVTGFTSEAVTDPSANEMDTNEHEKVPYQCLV